MNTEPASEILCPYCEASNFVNGQCPACFYFPLKGESEVTFIKRTARRVGCSCGNVATQRHTYLLEGGRSNPRSSAYRGDDVSWCSDHQEFTCGKCKAPRVDGYQTCSIFSITPSNDRFAHLFLERKDTPFLLGAVAPDLLRRADALLGTAMGIMGGEPGDNPGEAEWFKEAEQVRALIAAGGIQ